MEDEALDYEPAKLPEFSPNQMATTWFLYGVPVLAGTALIVLMGLIAVGVLTP